MESVPCAVCGSRDCLPLWTKEGARYVRCRQCTLVYENPRLDRAELKELYSRSDYFVRADPAAVVVGYEDYFRQCTPALLDDYFDIVQHYARAPKGRFLDIGCGPGKLLRVAKSRGWDAMGLEISDWAVDQGTKEGLNILNMTLPEANLPADSFQAATMFDVLEHLPDPAAYLGEVYRVLSPGGVLVVETPNIDGLFAKHLYREKSELIKPRAHICLYTPQSVRRLFGETEFKEVRVMTFPYSRKFTMTYIKGLIGSRIRPGRVPLQFTWDESFRIVGWK